MKRIIKKEPEFFRSYIQERNPNDWASISKVIGFDIRTYILHGDESDSEQNNQCAYTEIAIKPDSNSSHIDHYLKQSLYSNMIFNWDNLFVACNSELYGAKYKDTKVRRGNESIYDLLLNPSIDNPRDYFYYSITGMISPKSNDENSVEYKKAKTTIDIFNLNEKSLREKREGVAKGLYSYRGQFSVNEIKGIVNEFDTFIEEVYTCL